MFFLNLYSLFCYYADKRSKYEQEEEGKHKANTEGKFSLEQERERIKVNIAIRKQMMEEEERKEKLRMEKIEKRNLELKLETERLAALKGSQEINELINEEKQEEKQLEENEPVVHNDSSSSVNLSAEQQNQSEEDQFVLGEKYKDVNWDNPRIPLSINYHVPATTRQKILEKLINAYSKKFQDVKDKAIHRQKSVIYALESELELYNKYRESSAYWLNASSFISRMGKSDVTPSNVKTQ